VNLLRHRSAARRAQPEELPEARPLPAATEPRASEAQVIYGASVQALPLAGLMLAQARDVAQAILRVDPRAQALVNGTPAEDDRVIAAGDTLEFVHHAGEKGSGRWTCASRSPAKR
jgi:hypothetical protein